MKKFLIAALLMLLMSGAAFAADRPRVLVMDAEIKNVLDEKTNTLIDFADRYELNDLIIHKLVHSKRFRIIDPIEKDLLEKSRDQFIDEHDIKYLICPEVMSVNTQEKILDSGLKIYKLRFEIKTSMVDAKTREVLCTSQSKVKVTSEGREPQNSIQLANAMHKAVDKAIAEILKQYDARVKKGE